MKTAILCVCVGLVVGYGTAVVRTQSTPERGYQPVRLIDRDEIRVSRVDLEPNAVRAVHSHTDVLYHVWIPISEHLTLTTGGETQNVKPWQAFFFKKGTPHGFANPNPTPASVIEIFVKDPAASQQAQP